MTLIRGWSSNKLANKPVLKDKQKFAEANIPEESEEAKKHRIDSWYEKQSSQVSKVVRQYFVPNLI